MFFLSLFRLRLINICLLQILRICPKALHARFRFYFHTSFIALRPFLCPSARSKSIPLPGSYARCYCSIAASERGSSGVFKMPISFRTCYAIIQGKKEMPVGRPKSASWYKARPTHSDAECDHEIASVQAAPHQATGRASSQIFLSSPVFPAL